MRCRWLPTRKIGGIGWMVPLNAEAARRGASARLLSSEYHCMESNEKDDTRTRATSRTCTKLKGSLPSGIDSSLSASHSADAAAVGGLGSWLMASASLGAASQPPCA